MILNVIIYCFDVAKIVDYIQPCKLSIHKNIVCDTDKLRDAYTLNDELVTVEEVSRATRCTHLEKI